MPKPRSKRPRDMNQLAKFIVDMATGEIPKEGPPPEKDAAAVSMGKRGGAARASKLSAAKRKAIAKKAAKTRWKK